jgi:hypothetical protein
MSTVAQVGLNGTTAGAGKGRRATKGAARRKVPKMSARQVGALALWITVGMGCAIPMLALALSHAAGKLAGAGHYLLGAWALVLCGAVLSVSLPHLACAIADITRSDARSAWALAIAVDVSLVFCETAAVMGGDTVSPLLIYAVMVGLTVASMVLNCWAFLRTPHK